MVKQFVDADIEAAIQLKQLNSKDAIELQKLRTLQRILNGIDNVAGAADNKKKEEIPQASQIEFYSQ